MSDVNNRSFLRRYAWLSILAAILTIGIKAAGYWLTRSVGLLSDALESGVNLVAAVSALAALTISAQPPDEDHAYGHQKVEYLSSGAEGGLIALAAILIIIAATERLLEPLPLSRLGIGLALSAGASLINLVVGSILIRIGRRHHSIALEADGQHLMTDVWTSVGVLIGVGLVALTGWAILDPIVAILVALQIGWTAFRLLRRSALGLIDTALPREQIAAIQDVLNSHNGVQYHALRTRQAGARNFISLHVQVPGDWSVQHGHDILETIEAQISTLIPNTTVFTHLEPVEDPLSWSDEGLDRTLNQEEQA
ncbi:MAG: cation transporter [Anaerolineales bacterium]|nr:MAG: cation transporter [Anaerolineales bacterium]